MWTGYMLGWRLSSGRDGARRTEHSFDISYIHGYACWVAPPGAWPCVSVTVCAHCMLYRQAQAMHHSLPGEAVHLRTLNYHHDYLIERRTGTQQRTHDPTPSHLHIDHTDSTSTSSLGAPHNTSPTNNSSHSTIFRPQPSVPPHP